MTFQPSTLCDAALGAAPADRLGWAQRLLRRQLDTLARLVLAVVGMVGTATEATGDRVGIIALEDAIRRNGRVEWALRLIAALRAKLVDRLQKAGARRTP